MDSAAQIFFRHAAEERNHMMKMLEYILNRGAKAIVTAIPAPTTDPVTVNDCFEKYLSMKWITQNPFIKW
jgi:ferritin